MEIPVGAQVECTDGLCGRLAYVLLNPVTGRVTHLVVQEDAPPHTEYIVPLEILAETLDGTVQLRCSKAELQKMNPFVKTEFVQQEVPDVYPELGTYGIETYYWPYVVSEHMEQVPVEHLQIPPGELAVRRGTRVKATDGDVGRVDEFVVNAENGHITHLVMREGHLWGEKDVIIPVSAIDQTQEDAVLLKLDKRQIESLPTFPVRRRWA